MAATMAAGLIAGCGGEKKAANSNEIKIGGNFELSGGVANYGQSTMNGVKLAFKEINEKGGINGKKISLVIADNKSEASEAANAVTKLITQDKVVALIGPVTSSNLIATTQIATDKKIPVLTPTATSPKATFENGKVKEMIFRSCFIDPFQGEVMARSDKRPTEIEIRQALPRLIGEIDQTPPIFSALKVNGARAYDLARTGQAVELKSRKVKVYDLRLIGTNGVDGASFRVDCGKGTYVRALARDLSTILGTCGYVTALRRVKAGPFGIESAISLEKLEELSHKDAAGEALLSLTAALDDIPGWPLTSGEAQQLRQGQPVLIRPHHLSLLDAKVILACLQDEPVALVEAKAGAFHVLRGFNFLK